MNKHLTKMVAVLLALCILLSMQPVTDAKAETYNAAQAMGQAALLYVRENDYFGKYDIFFANDVQNNNVGNNYGTTEWCGWFVRYIAKKMNIPISIIPKYGGVSQYVADSRYKSKNSYTPVVGDVIVVNSKGHVGIVYDVDNAEKKVYWVSGNYSETVKKAVHSFTSDYINGYFHPNYSSIPSKTIEKVTGIDLGKSSLQLANGGTYTFSPAITPSNAFDKTLIWTSSDINVATVGKYTGVVKAVGNGTAAITAKALADGKGTSSAAISTTCMVTVGSTGPSVAKTGTYNGHTYKVYASNYTWTQARDFAKSAGGYLAAISSSGEQDAVSGLVSSYGHACWLGASNLSGSWKWITGESFSYTHWDNGEPSGTYGSTSENYLGIYGNSTQTSYATDKYWNDFTNTSSTLKGFVIEFAPIPVEKITLNPASGIFAIGKTLQITAEVTPTNAGNKELAWSSSNTQIATVNANGLVTGLKAGNVVITAAAKDGSGITAICSVAIHEPLEIGWISFDNYNAVSATETITCTTYAQGGSGTKSYRFDLYKDGKLLNVGTYSSKRDYSFKPSEAGIYKIRLYVKDSSATVDAYSDEISVLGNYNGFVYNISGGEITVVGYSGSDINLVIPDQINGLPVTEIGEGYGFNDEIKSVMIPASVKKVESNAFSDNIGMTNIYVAEGNTVYASYDGLLYNKALTTLLKCPDGYRSNYKFPSSIKTIGEDAFEMNRSLQKITIPYGVETIGDLAFAECYSLSSVMIPNTVKKIGIGAFSTCSLSKLYIPPSVTIIGESLFGDMKTIIIGEAGSYAQKYANDNDIPFEATASELAVTSMNADKSAVIVGTAITWTAVSTGGEGTKTYRFKLYKDGVELIGGTYGFVSTYKYTPTQTGTYKVRVYVKDSTGTVTKDSANVTVIVPLSITSVTADKTSANAGSPITWSSTATGGSGTKSYLFKLYKDGIVIVDGTYSSASTYKYTPTQAGTYKVRAYVKDSSGTVAKTSADIIVKVPLSITSIKADKTSTIVGSPITWTAAATGGSGTKSYRFKLYKNGTEIVGGTYGSANTYKYTPTEAGTYKVRTYIMDSTGTITKDSADVVVYKPLSITSVKADRTSANAGTAITWTATATGGIGTKTYRFLLYKDGTDLTSSKYTTNASYKFTPTATGTYRVRAYVKDSTGEVSLKSADVTVKAPLTITSVNSNVTSIDAGSEITWTAAATGGSGPKAYRFKLYKDDIVLVGGTYGPANAYKYTPTEAGIYKVRVYVKDSSVTETKDSLNVTVE